MESELKRLASVYGVYSQYADAVRQYAWLFSDVKNRVVDDVVILSGDHL